MATGALPNRASGVRETQGREGKEGGGQRTSDHFQEVIVGNQSRLLKRFKRGDHQVTGETGKSEDIPKEAKGGNAHFNSAFVPKETTRMPV